MIDSIHLVLFTFLAVIAIGVIRMRDLFAAVMMTGIFSLLSACLFTVMDAVDVAFTEAAVGSAVARRSLAAHAEQNGVAVAIEVGVDQLLGVAGSLALPPQALPRARPVPALAAT